jgi:hypothetical protein
MIMECSGHFHANGYSDQSDLAFRARAGRSGMLWAGFKPVGDHQKGQLGLLLPILARYHPETLY